MVGGFWGFWGAIAVATDEVVGGDVGAPGVFVDVDVGVVAHLLVAGVAKGGVFGAVPIGRWFKAAVHGERSFEARPRRGF